MDDNAVPTTIRNEAPDGLGSPEAERGKPAFAFAVVAVAVVALLLWGLISFLASGTNLSTRVVGGPVDNLTCSEHSGHVTATGTSETNGLVVAPIVVLLVEDSDGQMLAQGVANLRRPFDGSWKWTVSVALPVSAMPSECVIHSGGAPIGAVVGGGD